MGFSLDEETERKIDVLVAKTKAIRTVLFLLIVVFFMNIIAPNKLKELFTTKNKATAVVTEHSNPDEQVKNGIHIPSGLKASKGYETVISNCGNCHSLKLVTQNRATKEGWSGIIKWMQKTQNLWELGANEEIILEYLSKNYAPEDKGRRAPLTNIEWYELEE